MHPALTLAAAQLRADLRHARSGRRSAGRVATTALAYGFSGLILALSLGDAPPDQVLFVSASFGIVLAAFGVVGSYDELMGRPKENAWLATLPATEGEHYGARLLGIGAYVALMALSVAVPVGVRTGLAYGTGAGLAVGAGIVGSVVWTAMVSLAALWSLTLALPQRALRVALSVTRTVLIAALVLGFQLIGASSDALEAPWWPGAWMADALFGRSTLGLAILLVSVGGMIVLFGTVFPTRYFSLLRRLADGARRAETRGRAGRRLSGLERTLTPSGPIRAAYGFAVAAFADDRLVRGRLWPAALLPVGFVAFGWLTGGLGSLLALGPADPLTRALSILQDPDTQLHLSVLVVLLFCAQSLVQTLQFSDHAEAAWTFGTLPEARPRLVQLGAQKALVFRILFPLSVGLTVLLTFEMPALDAVLHGAFWFAILALVTRIYALLYRKPPFSRRSDRFNASSRFLPFIVSIPSSVIVLILQAGMFTSPTRAAIMTAGLFAASVLLGEIVSGWRRPSPRRAVTPVPLPPEAPALDAAA